MRIIVVNPLIFRADPLGACEQDRLTNVGDLQRLGHEVCVVTQQSKHLDHEALCLLYQKFGYTGQLFSAPIVYEKLSPVRLTHIGYLDGATWQSRAKSIYGLLEQTIRQFQPDIVWAHGTYMWPVAQLSHRYNTPVIIRSINYESHHFWQEYAHTAPNYLRFIGKWFSERTCLNHADVVAAITPQELENYRHISPKSTVMILPLRRLPHLLNLPQDEPQETRDGMFHVVFMGASYNVFHNVQALEFIVREIIPSVRIQYASQFIFHILGSRVPKHLEAYAAPDLIFEGFVPDLDAFLKDMDIALMPSLSGTGMQQKVFESLARGIPTVTHHRALVGFPFRHNEHLLLANSPAVFVEALGKMRNLDLRQRLSQASRLQAVQLFSRERIDQLVTDILQQAAN